MERAGVVRVGRRTLLRGAALGGLTGWLAACASDSDSDSDPDVDADSDSESSAASVTTGVEPAGAARRLFMPAEEALHEATWMCLPARRDVWGSSLPDVQATIADIALAVAAYEPVRMLVRPDDLGRARDLVGGDIELIEAPVDDLWARDTLPLFLVDGAGALAAGRVEFNGWGGDQVHDGDTRLAGIVADVLGIELIDSGLVGEGGGLETDGAGTLLAARSSWIDVDRNPGVGEDEIADVLVDLLGAERLLWVDGIAGEDITDGHIDTLARFVDPSTIINEMTADQVPGETWHEVAMRTAEELAEFTTLDGEPYRFETLRQPATIRGDGPDFLASYVNYYVCNGAVLIPEFGDADADAMAAEQIGRSYPDREIVVLDIDPVAAGGGGIHCATQQQPAVTT